MKKLSIKIFIALIIAVAVVLLVDSYEKKRSPASSKDKGDKTPNLEQQVASVDTDVSLVISSTGVPNEREIEQVLAQDSTKPAHEVLQDIETTKIEVKTLKLAEILGNMREITTAAVDTGKALLSADFSKEVESSIEVRNQKEGKDGYR